MSSARPWVTLKIGASLDGRTALADGASRWITGEASRADVQRLRARASAIVTGIGTVLADDPLLTVRDPALDLLGRRPLRVVLDTSLRIPPGAKVLDASAPTIVFTSGGGCRRARGARRSCRETAGALGPHRSRRGCSIGWARSSATSCSSRRGPGWPAVFSTRASSTSSCSTVAPCVLGDTALPMFRLPTLRRMEERRDLAMTEAVRIGEDLRIVLRPHGRSALMFTGIIRGLGRLRSIDSRSGDASLVIDTGTLSLTGVGTGDSIAVNGVCLTVTRLEAAAFAADVSRETLGLTTLGALSAGAFLNLETALRAGDALGGHYVSGHVDGVARVMSREDDARSVRIEFELPSGLERYVARKGSICIDGVSLTVNEIRDRRVGVNLVPHTLSATNADTWQSGTGVNCEVDMIARYLERLACP